MKKILITTFLFILSLSVYSFIIPDKKVPVEIKEIVNLHFPNLGECKWEKLSNKDSVVYKALFNDPHMTILSFYNNELLFKDELFHRTEISFVDKILPKTSDVNTIIKFTDYSKNKTIFIIDFKMKSVKFTWVTDEDGNILSKSKISKYKIPVSFVLMSVLVFGLLLY